MSNQVLLNRVSIDGTVHRLGERVDMTSALAARMVAAGARLAPCDDSGSATLDGGIAVVRARSIGEKSRVVVAFADPSAVSDGVSLETRIELEEPEPSEDDDDELAPTASFVCRVRAVDGSGQTVAIDEPFDWAVLL